MNSAALHLKQKEETNHRRKKLQYAPGKASQKAAVVKQLLLPSECHNQLKQSFEACYLEFSSFIGDFSMSWTPSSPDMSPCGKKRTVMREELKKQIFSV